MERVLAGDLNQLSAILHQTAKEKGWWNDQRSDAECIALMHSELSEALEALRHGDHIDEHCPAHMNSTVEMADCIIRILDWCGAKGVDIGGALMAKAAFNKTRPYKHGKRM